MCTMCYDVYKTDKTIIDEVSYKIKTNFELLNSMNHFYLLNIWMYELLLINTHEKSAPKQRRKKKGEGDYHIK